MELFSMGYLLVQNVALYWVIVYIAVVLNLHYRWKKSSFIILSIPIIIDVAIILTNPIHQQIFYFTPDKMYYHGYLMNVLYADAFVYLITGILLLIKYHDALGPIKLISFILVFVFSCIPVGYQMVNSEVLIQLFFESMALLAILLAMENADEVINPITKTYNRYALLNDIETNRKNGIHYSLISVKIANFRYYNQTLGVVRMARMIGCIAEWFNSVFDDPLINVYYAENARFAILVYNERRERIKEITETIFNRFNKKWSCSNIKLSLPAEIAVFNVPRDIKESEQILLNVDTRFDTKLQETKIIYGDSSTESSRRIAIEQAIRKAIAKKSFLVYFQPIWDVKNEKIHSAEALVRMIDDDLGFLPPDEFISIAEENGSIIEIGEIVLDKVCRSYQEHNMQKLGLDYIEVNLSVLQCLSENLVTDICGILDQAGMPAIHINLEVTESAMMSNHDLFFQTINELKAKGFSFSLDDYGTGYSNISYIFELPFDLIKIDKGLLWASDTKAKAKALLEHTIQMMHAIGLKTVVEGAETKEHIELLKNLETDYIQGFYFSKPLPVEDFVKYCKKINWKIED
ncbi:MAG: EAL domain-containing protein [Lachnospiraceae bacterium]|nr:EAL domain-containing protein [Lachnospiraceae bacterium]